MIEVGKWAFEVGLNAGLLAGVFIGALSGALLASEFGAAWRRFRFRRRLARRALGNNANTVTPQREVSGR